MSELKWHETGSRQFETGVSQGVYYPKGGFGEAWNGLVSVQADEEAFNSATRFIDGISVGSRSRKTTFSGVIEAYSYPESFYSSNLMPHIPRPFDMCYRTRTHDKDNIHLVYNVLVSPTSTTYKFEDRTPYSWPFTTKPEKVIDGAPSAHLIIETSQAYASTVKDLEDILYGDDVNLPSMPSALGVLEVFERNSVLRIIDHGDGTWSADGPEEYITMVDETTFAIDYPTAVYNTDGVSYTIHSL